MTGELSSREGGSPSPAGLAEEISGDGPLDFGKLPRSSRRLRPAQGHGNFASGARKLAGLVPAVTAWTPEQFWRATPAELAAIFAVFSEHAPGHFGQVPLGIEQLEQLKEIFPDG